MSTTAINKTQNFFSSFFQQYEKSDKYDALQDRLQSILSATTAEEVLQNAEDIGVKVVRPIQGINLSYQSLKKGTLICLQNNAAESVIGLITKAANSSSSKARIVCFSGISPTVVIEKTISELMNLGIVVDFPIELILKGLIDINDIAKVLPKQYFQYLYNENDVIIRIGSNSPIIFEFPLFDEKLNPINYDDNENNYGQIKLPKGAKVVKLNINKTETHFHILAWWKGKYREGYLSADAFEKPIVYDEIWGNGRAKEVFLNDIEQIISRIQDKVPAPTGQFKTKILDTINSLLDSVKAQITDNLLYEVRTEYYEYFEPNGNNVEFLNRLKTEISNAFAPEFIIDTHNDTISTGLVYIPLSGSWFENIPSLDTYFPSFVSNCDRLAFIKDEGIVGDTISQYDTVYVPKAVNALTSLRQFAQNDTNIIAANSPELDWLNNSNFSTNQGYIAFYKGFWLNQMGKTRDGFIGFLGSLGPIKPIPQLTILTHEINMACDFLPNETHLSSEDYWANIWNDAANNKFFSDILPKSKLEKQYSKLIDNLYLSESYIDIVNVLIILRRIYKKLNP